MLNRQMTIPNVDLSNTNSLNADWHYADLPKTFSHYADSLKADSPNAESPNSHSPYVNMPNKE